MNTKSIKVLGLAAAIALTGAMGLEAQVVNLPTSKGARLALVGTPTAGNTVSVAGFHAGCPGMQQKIVTRNYAADSKGRTVEKKTELDQTMPQCKVRLARDTDSKQAGLVMEHR